MKKKKEELPWLITNITQQLEEPDKFIMTGINSATYKGQRYGWKSPSSKDDPYSGWMKYNKK